MGVSYPPQLVPAPPPTTDPSKRLEDLISGYAGWLQKPFNGDPGLDDPQEAMLRSIEHFSQQLKVQGDQGVTDVKDYLSGQTGVPQWWVHEDPAKAFAESERRHYAQEAAQQREDHPVLMALHDYIGKPLVGTAYAFAQVPVDVVIGGLNKLGAKIEPQNLMDRTRASMRVMFGSSKADETAPGAVFEDISSAIKEAHVREEVESGQESLPAQALSGIGETIGSTMGMFGGGAVGAPAKFTMGLGRGAAVTAARGTFWTAQKIVGKAVAAPLPQLAQRLIGAAGAFGAYEGVKAPNEEAGKAALVGAVMGPAYETLNMVAKLGFGKIMAGGVEALGTSERSSLNALRDWATEQNLHIGEREPEAKYIARITSAWVDAGAPGATIPFRKLFAHATQAGLEGIGYSAIDLQLLSDLHARIWDGDVAAGNRALVKLIANPLGMAAIHVGFHLKDIPAWQRAQPSKPTYGQRQAFRGMSTEQVQTEPGEQPAEFTVKQDVKGLLPQPEEPERQAALEQHLQELGVEPGPESPEVAAQREREIGERFSPAALHAEQGIIRLGYGRQEPVPGTIDYNADDSLREWMAKQAGDLTGTVKVQVNQNQARNAMRRAPKTLRDKLDVVASGTAPSGEVEVTGEEAKTLLESHRRRAPKDRVTEGEKIAQPKIQSVDDLARKLLVAFGKEPVPPTGLPVTGPGGPTEPPLGELRTGEAPRTAERREGPGEEGGAQPVLNPEPPEPGPAPAAEGEHFAIPDSPYSYTLLGGLAYPSARLRSALGMPESLSVDEFLPKLHKASLISAMHSMALLPGQRLNVNGETIDGDKIRVIRYGELVDRGADFESKFRPADGAPARGPDPIGAVQQKAVEALKAVSNPNLAPEDQAVLSTAAATLANVSATNDRAVGETMAALPAIMPMIHADDPIAAGRAIEALAEMLTTKHPTVAAQDLASEQQGESQPVPAEPVRPTGEPATKQAGAEPSAVQPSETTGEAIPGKEPKSEQLGPSEVGSGGPIKEVARLAVKGVQRVFEKVTEFLGLEDQIPKVRRVVGPEAADRFERIKAKQAVAASEQAQAVDAVERHAAFRDPELARLRPYEKGEPLQAVYSNHLAYKESALQERFGLDRSDLPAQSQETLRLEDQLDQRQREMASERGMELTNVRDPQTKNPVPIAGETDRTVLTRQPTMVLRDALVNRGDMYDDLVNVLASENGIAKEKVQKILEQSGWTEARGLERLSPIEVRRQLKYFPDYMTNRNGRLVHLLENDPVQHAKSQANAFAQRVGVYDELGPDRAPTKDEKERLESEKLLQSDLPTPYVHLVLEQQGRVKQDAVAQALRAASGMAIDRLRGTDPNSVIYQGAQWLNQAVNVYAALKMTKGSPVQNLVEALGTGTSWFGFDAVRQGMEEAWAAVRDGKIHDLQMQLAEEGGYQTTNPNWSLGGGATALETAKQLSRIGSQAALVPFDFTQVVNDVGLRLAAGKRVDAMKNGDGTVRDQVLARRMGFSPADAQRLADGRGTQEEYLRVLSGVLPRLTGRGMTGLDKSDFALGVSKLGRAGPQLIRFTGYLQRQINNLRFNLKDFEAGNAGSGKALTSFFFQNMLAGSAGIALLTFLDEGLEGLGQHFHELTSSPLDAAAEAGYALLSNTVGGQGQTLYQIGRAMMTNEGSDDARAWQTLTSTMTPIGMIRDFADFGIAFGKSLTNSPEPSGIYGGKSPLGVLGTYVTQAVPLTKTVQNGLFGSSFLAIGKDPMLEASRKSAYKWLSRHTSNKIGAGGDEPNDAAFAASMRKAVDDLGAKYSESDVEAAIRKANPDKEDKEIVQSLESRRLLTKSRMLKGLTEEQVGDFRKFLGDQRWSTLTGYDTAIDNLADQFRPMFPKRHRLR